MRKLFHSAFARRFVGGFTLGVAALVALQPAAVSANLGLAPVAAVQP